jgi:hypothetical protein
MLIVLGGHQAVGGAVAAEPYPLDRLVTWRPQKAGEGGAASLSPANEIIE